MKFQTIIDKIDYNQLKTLYIDELKDLKSIGKALNISVNSVKKLIIHYNLTRNLNGVKSKSLNNSSVKHSYYNNIKSLITKEDIYQWYIVEDNNYTDAPKHFGISQWQFDKLCSEYGIKKDRKKTISKSFDTKYNKYGSKDNYNNHVTQATTNTRIEKYGSESAYTEYISGKCSKAWALKSGKEIQKHRDNLHNIKINLPKDVKLNISRKRKTTLKTKYGVNNSFALAKFTNNSKPNAEFEQLLKSNNIQYEREFAIGSQTGKFYKYDFRVENNLIEINPWPFHNSTFNPIPHHNPLDKNYHLDKSNVAKNNNYRCIHIFDWDDKEKIINYLQPKSPIYARKCSIKTVDLNIATQFLNNYHFQGTCNGQKIILGLYYKDELIQLMSFGKPRYNKNYEWELLRLCTNPKHAVVGGSQKLFSYFINNYNPTSIISYCDNSKFTGDVYSRLGFILKSKSAPTKHWFNIKTNQHITDNLLRQKGFDNLFGTEYGKGTDNNELMRIYNFVEIYDCGQSTYIWNR